jgi:general secretion pathway protein G
MDISRKNGRSGMTLIEILIVVMLLGILAGVLVKSLSGTGEAGKQAAAKLACETTLKTALLAYRTVKGSWPDTKAALIQSGFIDGDAFTNPWGLDDGYTFEKDDNRVKIAASFSNNAVNYNDADGNNGCAFILAPSGKLEEKAYVKDA